MLYDGPGMSGARQSASPSLIGRYEVRHKLGEGGMGVVYAAYDPELEREVAVKLLRRDRSAGPRLEKASEALRREARITARLAHPNVVTIYDVGQHGESVYIAMELVHGPSLHQWLYDIARPWREVLAMFFQAGFGLAAAHDAGLIHRDFKPGNVLIGDRRARVVDFGLARAGIVPTCVLPEPDADVLGTAPSEASATRPAMETAAVLETLPNDDDLDALEGDVALLPHDVSTTTSWEGGPLEETVDRGVHTGAYPEVASSGRFVGTPAYMAPELFTGGTADARTDQFAYCVGLYEGLYGYRPFAGETAIEIAAQVLAGRIRKPPERTRVPGWVRDIILKGLAGDPDARHDSMRSLLASVAFVSRIMWD
jgi:eukaryotic-like serine/threonine-protein kinase